MSDVDAGTLTGSMARGGVYVLIRRMSANALRIGAIAVLARELSKAEFGVAALAQMAAALLTVFGSGGIITYILCDRDVDWEQRVSPAFWLNVALAIGSCVVALVCVPFVQSFYDEPLVGQVLLVLLATYFITQLRMVPEALLQRQLRFRVLAIRDGMRDFFTAGLAIVMALSGMGVWSLVLPNLLAAPFDVLFTFTVSRFRPAKALGRAHWPRIFRFTRSVMGEQFLTFIGNEADTAVVGKVMGSAVLGVYNLAYQLANLIGKNVSAVLTMVSTPALATTFERKTGMGPPYRKMMRVLSFVSVPLLLGMFVLADELVFLVYGHAWDAAVPLLRIFIVSTLVRSVTSPSGAIFNVVGRPALSMQIVVGFLVVYIPALLLVSRRGSLLELALCVAALRVIVGLVSLYMSLDLISESKARVTIELLRPLLAGAVMSVVAWFTNVATAELGWPIPIRIAVVAVVGAGVYFGSAKLIAGRALEESVVLFRGLIARKRRSATSPREA